MFPVFLTAFLLCSSRFTVLYLYVMSVYLYFVLWVCLFLFSGSQCIVHMFWPTGLLLDPERKTERMRQRMQALLCCILLTQFLIHNFCYVSCYYPAVLKQLTQLLILISMYDEHDLQPSVKTLGSLSLTTLRLTPFFRAVPYLCLLYGLCRSVRAHVAK